MRTISTTVYKFDELTDAAKERARVFMRWIYWRLNEEHDYLMSDEAVDESILANAHEFTEDGNRA